MAITLDGSNASTVGVINSKTAVASTSGTSIEFTSIPSGVKRITVMLNGVSMSAATSNILIQLGTGATPTYTTTGYNAQLLTTSASGLNTALQSTGFGIINPLSATITASGTYVLTNLNSNIWTFFGSAAETSGTRMYVGSGGISLAAALTAVRITSSDTFDAGSINILYE